MRRGLLLIIIILCSCLNKNDSRAASCTLNHFSTKNVTETNAFLPLTLKIKKPDTAAGGHHNHFLKHVAEKIKASVEWLCAQKPDTLHKLKGTFALKKGMNVFGWHPYWMGSALHAYNFSLLSHVAYFSYEVNPKTGSYHTIHDWNETDLVQKAKAANPNCKVLITITCFDKPAGEFLGRPKAQAVLIDSVIALLKRKKGDGVNVDFEDIPPGNRDKLTLFMKNLSSALKKNNMTVTMALPAIETENFDVVALQPCCDLFIVMAYGYYGHFGNSPPGPVSPLNPSFTWGKYAVSASMESYCAKIPPAKVLMGVPYYGAIWETRNCDKPAATSDFIKYSPYTYSLVVKGGFPFDSTTASGCNCYDLTKKPTPKRQYWNDDSLSLSVKYDWAIQHKLGGIGIWALGFDNGSTELWDLIRVKFAAGSPSSPSPAVAADSTSPGSIISTGILSPQDSLKAKADSLLLAAKGGTIGSKIRDLIKLVAAHKYSAAFVVFFGFLAFLLALAFSFFKPDIKAVLKEKKIYRVSLSLVFLLLYAAFSLLLSLLLKMDINKFLVIDLSLLGTIVLVALLYRAYLNRQNLP